MNWIPIKEKLPEHGQCVLISNGTFVTAASTDRVSSPDGVWWNGCQFDGYEWKWDFKPTDITHWAEMPTPPKTKNITMNRRGYSMEKQLEEAIKALAKRIVENIEADDAVKFTQAALSATQALMMIESNNHSKQYKNEKEGE